jgi:hypothetical protein
MKAASVSNRTYIPKPDGVLSHEKNESGHPWSNETSKKIWYIKLPRTTQKMHRDSLNDRSPKHWNV